MPTYSYACKDCGHAFDIQQAFSDDALTTCPSCGGRLRKVFSAVGVVFKGSGFYRTDSRGSGKASAGTSTSRDAGSGGSGSSDGGSSDGSGTSGEGGTSGSGTSGTSSSTGKSTGATPSTGASSTPSVSGSSSSPAPG